MSRWSLRVRLVAGTVALVAIGLLIANVAAVSLLRSYLMDRLDSQLLSFSWRDLGETAWWESGPRAGQLPSRYVVTLLDSQGRVLRQFATADQVPPSVPQLDLSQARDEQGEFLTLDAQNGPGRYRAVVDVWPDGGGSIVVALSMDDLEATVRRLGFIVAVVSLVVLALIAGLGLLVVRLGLRPLGEIERTAGAIAAGDLSQRVRDEDERTEVGRLGRSLNAMLAQIENAFAQRTTSEERLRRFVADASHELRTPLTSIRGYAELYRQGAATSAQDVPRLFGRIESEATRMSSMVDDLLVLARLDQQRPLERQPVDVAGLAADAVTDARAVQPERPLAFTTSGSGPFLVVGDEARLRQVYGNLLSNALEHTPASVPVHVSVSRHSDEIVVEVADEGPGLEPEVASRVFERFFRADPSRSRTDGGGTGTGLGLSIVAAIAAAHGGDAEVQTAPGRGSRFRVNLPAAAPAAVDALADGSAEVIGSAQNAASPGSGLRRPQ
jgi:two-component system, OmpR family, sensor kinase